MKFLRKLLPDYSWLPLAACLIINILGFQGTRFLNTGIEPIEVAIPAIDNNIPLVAPWVIVYLGCYITWIASYWLIAREEKKICYHYYASEIIGKFIATAFYIFMPTVMATRPEISELGSDIWSEMLKAVYAADTPNNLFPSLHCFASWFACRGLLDCKKVPKWYIWVSFVSMFLVFASVLYTRQHVFVDIFGGIAVAEMGFLIARLTRAYRVFDLIKYKHYPEPADDSKIVEI